MNTFVIWWLRQLAGLVPAGFLDLSAKRPDAAILGIEPPHLMLYVRRRGQIQPLGQVRGDPSGFQEAADVFAAARERPRLTLLRLPVANALRKELSLPLAAESDLATLIGFEMDRETPFSRDEVYWGYRIRRRDVAGGRLLIDLLIVPRASVAEILTFAREAGLHLAGIEVQTPDDVTVLIRLDDSATKRSWRPDRTTGTLAAAAAILLLIAIAGPFIRQQWSLATIDRDVASLTAQAKEASALRKSIDQLTATQDFLNKERGQNRDALAILAALTRVLPDDTHLTALSFRDGKLTIAGTSPSAASLIPLLTKTSPFREPAFVSPVVQNADDGLEVFTISVSVTQAGAS
jgi:general secretion pathway protein L